MKFDLCIKILVAAVVGLGIGFACYYALNEPHRALVERSVASKAPTTIATPHSASKLAPTSLGGSETLVSRLAALHASGDPQDAFDAYWVIRECMNFEDNPEAAVLDTSVLAPDHPFPFRAPTTKEIGIKRIWCAGMTYTMQRLRFDDLNKALKAGVEGASIAFVEEGPFGDKHALETRPDDPLVQEWKRTAIRQLSDAANAGNAGAINYTLAMYASGAAPFGADREKVYRYAYVNALIQNTVVNQTWLTDSNAVMLQDYESGLSTQDIANARQAGNDIYHKWCVRTKHPNCK